VNNLQIFKYQLCAYKINILNTFCHCPYFSPEDLNTFSRISEKYSVKKSPERASEFRQQGNLSFKVKDYTVAALYYSKVRKLRDLNTCFV